MTHEWFKDTAGLLWPSWLRNSLVRLWFAVVSRDLGLPTLYSPSITLGVRQHDISHNGRKKHWHNGADSGFYISRHPSPICPLSRTQWPEAHGMRTVVSQPPVNHCDERVCLTGWTRWCLVIQPVGQRTAPSTEAAHRARALLSGFWMRSRLLHSHHFYKCVRAYYERSSHSSGVGFTTDFSAMINPKNLIDFQSISPGRWFIISMFVRVWKRDKRQRVKCDI